MMVQNNTVLHNTQFTVSIDLIGNGCTTGISTSDRSKTIKSLVDLDTKPHDLGRPGHIFPLKAKNGGVLRRTGHTEAAVGLARLAGLKPAGILVEILNDDGSMARFPELKKVAKKFDLKIISIEDLVAYRMEHDSLIKKKHDFQIETRFGDFRLRSYQQTTNNAVHIALTKGTWSADETVPTRINSTLVNNDILGTLTNNADQKLDNMFKLVNKHGKGAILFINQSIQAASLLKRLDIVKNTQQKGKIVKAPNIKMDTKDFGIGAQILHDLNIHKLGLISNSKQTKRVGIIGYGLEIIRYIKY
jgi:3,4-dihydroxy 2-butanone 4-phosphate synthase/GTP cyclohydrolase II